jgi:hypothetical protein
MAAGRVISLAVAILTWNTFVFWNQVAVSGVLVVNGRAIVFCDCYDHRLCHVADENLR